MDTRRRGSITNKEFFKRAANELTALLSAYTPEGMCYRVDLRLRPEGSLGEVCISLEGARQYYESRARDWELQMMIKARVAAGDRATGAALLDFVEPKIYSTTLDFSAIEALSVTRERINEKLARKKRSRGTRELDIKAGPRRHSRYRVPGPVPAAPLRRRRSLGAPRRHAPRHRAASR